MEQKFNKRTHLNLNMKLLETKHLGIEDRVLAHSTNVGLDQGRRLSGKYKSLNSAPYCLFFGKVKCLLKPNIQFLEETSDIHPIVTEGSSLLRRDTSNNAVLRAKC